MAKRNAFYAQSGGVTSVINASAAGVIEACRANKDKIGTLYAGQNGILGALHENLIDTSKDTSAWLKSLKRTILATFFTMAAATPRILASRCRRSLHG
jgi:6-phosphofructokinase